MNFNCVSASSTPQPRYQELLEVSAGIYATRYTLAYGFVSAEGLLAAAIIKMDGVGKEAGWRWIFILYSILILGQELTSSPDIYAVFTEKDWPQSSSDL